MLSEKGRTPCLCAVIDNKGGKNVMVYGHLDKQPPLTDKWTDGLHPYDPVIRDNKLYGRGAADDGYAFFLAICIIKMLQKYEKNKNRIVLFFETDEESGSKDLVYFIKKKKEIVGTPDFVFFLDSGSISKEYFCITTTLRGVLNF